MRTKSEAAPEKNKGMLTAKQYRRRHRNDICRSVLKILMLLAGVIAVVIQMGQARGWIRNANAGENWPAVYADYGWMMVTGTVLLAAALVLVLFRFNWLSLGIGTAGMALCAGMMCIFMFYASENSFYSDLLDMQVETLYILEMIPGAVSFLCLWAVGLLQFFSVEACEKRMEKRKARDAKAPPILEE